MFLSLLLISLIYLSTIYLGYLYLSDISELFSQLSIVFMLFYLKMFYYIFCDTKFARQYLIS